MIFKIPLAWMLSATMLPALAQTPMLNPGQNVQDAPGHKVPPAAENPIVPANVPQTAPNRTSMDTRQIRPMGPQPATPDAPSPAIRRAADTKTRPDAEALHLPNLRVLNLIGSYRQATMAPLPTGTTGRVQTSLRDGRLYLSLHDAIALSIENNLDVEVSRYNLFIADTDVLRARGGGSLRGVDLNIEQSPAGVGETSVPLLITSTAQTGGSPLNVNVEDLSQVTQAGNTTQQNLSANGTYTYSPGPPLPLFDPTVIGQAGYIRRSDQTSLISDTGSTSGTDTSSTTGPLSFVSAALDYQEGFGPGTQIDVNVSNAAQVLYAGNSQYDPFHAPSTSFTITQPLLRGLGRGVNLRFIHVALLDQKITQLVFLQQLLEVVYGTSRLYYDLVSLGENVGVKEEALAAAQKLYDDDASQVELGTLAPIELTRARALLGSSRLDLVQARALYRQQETILRQQLLRHSGDPAASFTEIIPTDRITVPDDPPSLDVSSLIKDALSNRPDLAQAGLQLKADEASLKGSRNGVLPNLSIYANAQTRGSSLVPYQILGSPGTGEITVPGPLTEGGLRLSTIYQGGVQLNLPLRNRIAQADAARDAIQLREAESRRLKMENEIRAEIENAVIALETAQQAYKAAVESRNYQQQLLQADLDKLGVGATTNLNIVQDQSYLAQARATEVAARSDWMKARIVLDRSLGDILDKNNISLDDAIRARVP
ncbi:TolC family protein [Tunturiibacter lichenicola]|uniref:TolC family protein n=1 Tax=Tunturiibacter lichenicola TaxID=2051959 RepID=UPI0021B4853D|nr:TolC family protein [Edaphobacter lichenicola]